MKKYWPSIVSWMIVLTAFILPIERKYDKAFRFFSLTLIPEGISLPGWFDKKIYYYPSDLMILLVLGLALFALKIPLKKLLTEKGVPFFLAIIFFAILSIVYSPLSNYPIPYLRLWQWCTAIIIYAVFVSLENEEQRKTVKRVVIALFTMAFFQSILAIAQYFTQTSFGLNFLNEPQFFQSQKFPFVNIQNGSLWLFDAWAPHAHTFFVRACGTLPHPNVLGGFLATTSLLTLKWMHEKTDLKKLGWILFFQLQLFALITTYSRASLYAFCLGAIFFTALTYRLSERKKWMQLIAITLSSLSLLAVLFQNQLYSRGGVVNYNKHARSADDYRLFYQKIAFQMIEENPIHGVGHGQFSLAVPKFLPPNSDQVVGVTHNIYLLLAAESGLFALFSFLFFISLLLRRWWQTERTVMTSTLLSMFIALLFIGGCDFYLIAFQQGRLLFFLVAALLTSQLNWKAKEPLRAL